MTPEDTAFFAQTLQPHAPSFQTLIENCIGAFALPLGVVHPFPVNGKIYTVPLVIEETSVVAALQKGARWIQEKGTLHSRREGRCALGQIHFPDVTDPTHFQHMLESCAPSWIHQANQGPAQSLHARGGGVQRITMRVLPPCTEKTRGHLVVVHVHIHTCDAMGANRITQIAEFLKGPIESATGATGLFAILSNLSDEHIVQTDAHLHQIPPDLGRKIQQASECAERDPYRAVTHNKGIMNGIDALTLATGNDWRAVEAGLHGYASTSGTYRPLSTWRYTEGILHGTFRGPIQIGTVGGMTRIHPVAARALRILNLETADELATLIGAVGLVQNLSALRALVTGGIMRGHMLLHIHNLMALTDAAPHEQTQLHKKALRFLKAHGHIAASDIQGLLAHQRSAAQTPEPETAR